jgi:hypothetical protein
MFEWIGLLFATVAMCVLSVVLGVVFGVFAWLMFWGRRRPLRLIAFVTMIPLASAAYLVAMAILLELVVPNQPDEFFGDFNEPLPHGYTLTGLGKMPDWAYFESQVGGGPQPQLLGGVRALEEDGDAIYGAYGHLDSQAYVADEAQIDHGYFVFDIGTGRVNNVKTRAELNARAGHTVHLVESQFFHSQMLGRVWLRRIENVVFFAPPAVGALWSWFLLFRRRLGESKG